MPSYNLSAHSSFPTPVLHSVHSTQDMLPCWRSTSVLLPSGSRDKGVFTVVFLRQRSAPRHSSWFPLSCPPHSVPLHKAAYFMCVQTHCCHAFGLECSTKHDCCFHGVAELAFKSLCQEECSWHTPHQTMHMNPALQTRIMIKVEITFPPASASQLTQMHLSSLSTDLQNTELLTFNISWWILIESDALNEQEVIQNSQISIFFFF